MYGSPRARSYLKLPYRRRHFLVADSPNHRYKRWACTNVLPEESGEDSDFSETEKPRVFSNHQRARSSPHPEQARTPTDLEAQELPSKEHASITPGAAEYDVATQTKLAYLGGWFLLNLALTIYNKAVLGEVTTNIYSSDPSANNLPTSSRFHGFSQLYTPAVFRLAATS